MRGQFLCPTAMRDLGTDDCPSREFDAGRRQAGDRAECEGNGHCRCYECRWLRVANLAEEARYRFERYAECVRRSQGIEQQGWCRKRASEALAQYRELRKMARGQAVVASG